MNKQIFLFSLLTTFLVANCWSQKTSYSTSGNFDKIILDQKITKVFIDKLSRSSVELEGVKEQDVEFKLSGETLSVTLTASEKSGVTAYIYTNTLRWIEGNPDLSISGADYLSGGQGKFLVRNMGSRLSLPYVATDFGDLDFDFDFDSDFDFDFDFDIEVPDFDFDFDFEVPDFDFDIDTDFAFNEDLGIKVIMPIQEVIKSDIKLKIKDYKRDLKREKLKEKQ